MKTILVVVVAVALFNKIQADPIDEDKIKEAKKILIDAFRRECIKHAEIEEQIVLDAKRTGIFPDDPKLKSYGLCMSKKLGLQNEKGELQLDVVREKIEKKLEDKERADEILKKCAIQKDNAEDTAFDAMKCFYENLPKCDVIPLTLTDPVDEDKIKEAKKVLIDAFRKECVRHAGIEEQIVLDVKRTGVFPEDPKFKSYGLCMSKKMRMQNEKGELQFEVIRNKIEKKVEDKEKAEEIFKKCAIQKDTAEDTAFEGMKCLWENLPKHEL